MNFENGTDLARMHDASEKADFRCVECGRDEMVLCTRYEHQLPFVILVLLQSGLQIFEVLL